MEALLVHAPSSSSLSPSTATHPLTPTNRPGPFTRPGRVGGWRSTNAFVIVGFWQSACEGRCFSVFFAQKSYKQGGFFGPKNFCLNKSKIRLKKDPHKIFPGMRPELASRPPLMMVVFESVPSSMSARIRPIWSVATRPPPPSRLMLCAHPLWQNCLLLVGGIFLTKNKQQC